MNELKKKNYAFIDSQNLYMSIRSLGWKLDFRKFRVYLREKYNIEKAFWFLGYVRGNESLYEALRRAGFICIFKPILRHRDGTLKGNVDAELVLQVMIECSNYDRAVLVTGDGDFQCLVKYLVSTDKLEKVLIPNQKKYSSLLKIFPSKYLAFINDLKFKIQIK